MEGLILGVNTMYMIFCFFRLFLIGCLGLMVMSAHIIIVWKEGAIPELISICTHTKIDYSCL